MTMPPRLLLVSAAVVCVALGAAAHALAGGSSEGYSFAGRAAPSKAYGVSARIAQIGAIDIPSGHVGAWVGVGGPGQGPGGTNEWLRAGYSGFPGVTGSDIYYEVAKPGRFPAYHQVAAALTVGTVSRVTVLAMRSHPGWWRVWVNRKPVSAAIHLPGTRNGSMPTARSECWDGGTGGMCNDFAYSFLDVSIARARGGDWQQLVDG
jgi:hypothetical protein